MGYTHYWTVNDSTGFEKALATIRKIVKKYQDIICFESDKEDTEPFVINEMIRFNGRGEDGHETFMVNPLNKGGDFCKTARKPYDIAVCECLLVLKHYLADMDLGSDGFCSLLENPELDGSWGDAIENVKEYGINYEFHVVNKREPYCDLEVSEIV